MTGTIDQGLPQSPLDRGAVLRHVHEGMKVVDAAGNEVGTITYVQLGDAEATTLQGNEQRASGITGAIGAFITDDVVSGEIPQPVRAKFLREGYLKIDARGFASGHYYVGASDVAGVDASAGRVSLAVPAAELVKGG